MIIRRPIKSDFKMCTLQMVDVAVLSDATTFFFLIYLLHVSNSTCVCNPRTLTQTQTPQYPGATQTWRLEGDALGWTWFQPDYRFQHVRDKCVCVRFYFPEENIFQFKSRNAHLAKEICSGEMFTGICVCFSACFRCPIEWQAGHRILCVYVKVETNNDIQSC